MTVLNLNVYDDQAQMVRFEAMRDAILASGARLTKHKYSRHSPRGRFVCLSDMRIDQQGSAKVTDKLYIKPKDQRSRITAPSQYCARPQRHLVVEWDGNVPICCAIDVTDKTLPSMGNINDSSLLDVWNGEQMMRYRWFTQQARRVLPGCSTCTHKMSYSHVVRKVQPSPQLQKAWEDEANAPRIPGLFK